MGHITTPPTPVFAIGMDAHTQHALAFMFKKHANNAYVLIEQPAAHALALVDLDSYGAPDTWQSYRTQWPQMPAVLLSLHSQSMEHAVWVEKPVKTAALLKALQQQAGLLQKMPSARQQGRFSGQHLASAGEGLEHRQAKNIHYEDSLACGTRPDIDLSNEAACEAIFYDPERYLQGALELAIEQAVKHASCVRLTVHRAQIVVSPQDEHVLCSLSETELHSVLLLPLRKAQYQIEILAYKTLMQVRQNSSTAFHVDTLMAFRWKVSLWTARGRLPRNTDLNRPVVLLQWPNLTRLIQTPSAIQICALWMQHPCTLANTAQQLKIPQRYVFALYNALHACHLALMERRRRVAPLSPKPVKLPAANSSFVHKLLARLMGSEAETA